MVGGFLPLLVEWTWKFLILCALCVSVFVCWLSTISALANSIAQRGWPGSVRRVALWLPLDAVRQVPYLTSLARGATQRKKKHAAQKVFLSTLLLRLLLLIVRRRAWWCLHSHDDVRVFFLCVFDAKSTRGADYMMRTSALAAPLQKVQASSSTIGFCRRRRTFYSNHVWHAPLLSSPRTTYVSAFITCFFLCLSVCL